MVEEIVGLSHSSGFRFPIASSPHFCIVLTYELLYVSSYFDRAIDNPLWYLLWKPRSSRLRRSKAVDSTERSGCEGRRKIPKGTKKRSVRIIACRKDPFLERHQGRGFMICKTQWQFSERLRMHRALRMVEFHRAAVY
jgi:hypothetical protein